MALIQLTTAMTESEERATQNSNNSYMHNDAIPTSAKAAAGGVASLDSNGVIPTAQLGITHSLGASGYRINSDGTIDEWLELTGGGAFTDYVQSVPLPFPNGAWAPMCSTNTQGILASCKYLSKSQISISASGACTVYVRLMGF